MNRRGKPSTRAEPDAEPAEPATHVFDRTSGVLGADGDEEDRSPDHGGTSSLPSSFGVPPITSL